MSGEMRMPFGRYKGWALSQVPVSYLSWLDSLGDLREPLRTAVDRELRMRHQEEHARRCGSGPIGQVLSPETAIAAERIVREGYRIAALESHPDRGGDTASMQAINEAAEVLRRWLGRVSPAQGRRRSA